MAISGMKFTHSAHISPQPKPEVSQRPAMWAMLSVGLAVGFMGMYLTITRPMSMRMQMVESNMSVMQTEMNQLVGTRDDLWKTNDLLTGLRHQQRQLAEAKQSLVAVRDMKNAIVSLADNHQLAMQSIEGMESMQIALMETQNSMKKSNEAIASMAMLQKSVVQLGSGAKARQAEMMTANKMMNEMEKLAARMVNQKEMVANADAVIDSVDELAASLMQREEPLAHSKTIVTQIASLQDTLVQRDEMLASSEKTVQKMADLERSLADMDQQAAMQASMNLKQMMAFQEEFSRGSERITAAIETVELMEEFQVELEMQADKISKMRRDLTEITFLESTVNQTLKVLKPLVQLSDLKRMSDPEIREAARVILDRRIADSRSRKSMNATRIAEQPIDSPKMSPVQTPKQEQLVPNPTDLE